MIETKTNVQRYDAYKDSGVEWLGQIPEHWNLQKLKSFLTVHGRIGFRGYTLNDLVNKGEGAVTISPSNMGESEMVWKKVSYLSWKKYYESPEIIVNEGDLLIVKTASIGKIAYVRELKDKATINPQILILKNIKINKDYFYYQLLSNVIQHQLQTDKIGSTIYTISENKILNFTATVPPLTEQTKIAQFLDDKTTKIEDAITIKEQQINLLKERKQILIHKAVTQGLNPNVKLKDSGVDWIGEIPEHWEVKRLKHCLNINNGSDYKHIQTDEGYPVIGSGGQFAYASEYMYDGEVVFLGRKGTIDKPLYFKGKFWAVDTMFYANTKNGNIVKFLYYLATTLPFSYYSTATALPSMTQSDLNNHPISRPPIDEQKKIVEYIENATNKIDTAIILKQQEIEKLKEYKSSLINSVVTGKVMVC
jgi:type I restriction enzyme S subunit